MDNKVFFYRRRKLSLSLSFLLLAPFLGLASDDVYQQQIQLARNGDYRPFLDYVQHYQTHHALTAGQVADWLQVALWAGQDKEVTQVWQRYQVSMPLPARGVAAAAQAWRNLRQWTPSLALWQQAQRLAPDNHDYRIGYIKTLIDALSERRVATPALRLSAQVALSPAHQRRLELAAVAETVRLATLPTRSEKARFTLAQTALNRYELLLTRWKNQPDAREDITRARIDRLGAYYANADYPRVITEYLALNAERQPLPDWAVGWVMLAYLEQQQADAALALLAKHPGFTPDAETEGPALFYALLDTGQYQAARRYLAQAMNNVPRFRYDMGDPAPQPNDRWLIGQSLYVEYLLMTQDLAQAQIEARRLAYAAPGNQGLQIDEAVVLQARGLPHAAERKLKMAEVLEPSNIELESQQAYVAMDLQAWRQMELLTADVMSRAPRDRSVQKLARLRDIHHFSELRLNAGQGLYSDNPVSGSHDFSWDATLYSPPMADNWRLFGGHRFAEGRFDEGHGVSRHAFGGVEWRARDAWVEAELSSNRFHGASKPGGRLSAWYRPADRWQAGGSLERIARSTPLRALRYGISANRAEGWLRGYQNERREYRISAAVSDFSDGNRRQEYGLTGRQQFWQSPSATLAVEPAIAASANSRRDTPYYNPARDLSVAAALSLDHLIYRHYDTRWRQQLVAGGGGYWQKQQNAGAITVLSYGQRVEWNNVLDAGVMVNWDKRPYDGKRESNLAVTFDATLRF